MTCFYPLTGYQRKAGSPLSFKSPAGLCRIVSVPCGQCHGCRLDWATAWATRCMHEASLYDHNHFVTLTYADSPGTLVPRDLELFWKRLRKVQPFRYFACGEYGDENGRPHYHALLFNFPCGDRYYWRKSGSGDSLYRSPGLEQVWGLGSVELGSVSFASAAYVARYAMKLERGKDATPQREILDVTSGEVVKREHEFLRMSRNPGIGSFWYEKFFRDVYPLGVVNDHGVKRKCPRYYDAKFKLCFPESFDKLSVQRRKAADRQFDDNSPRRLRDKEIVSKAKVSFLKRSL